MTRKRTRTKRPTGIKVRWLRQVGRRIIGAYVWDDGNERTALVELADLLEVLTNPDFELAEPLPLEAAGLATRVEALSLLANGVIFPESMPGRTGPATDGADAPKE